MVSSADTHEWATEGLLLDKGVQVFYLAAPERQHTVWRPERLRDIIPATSSAATRTGVGGGGDVHLYAAAVRRRGWPLVMTIVCS